MTSLITHNKNSTITFAVMLNSCVFLATLLLKCNFNKRPIVSIAIFVVVKSESNQDLSRKSSECKIYVSLNRNIKRKLSPLIGYIEHNLSNNR